MKILVTGAEGFLGKHLVNYLSENHEVHGYDIQSGRDILEFEQLQPAVAEVDIVIHLAAQANVRLSLDEPQKTFLTNTIGSIEVLKCCLMLGKKMIMASTIAATDPETTPYAHSKYLAEDVLNKFDNVAILRFTNLIGLNMNQRSGSFIYWFTQGLKTGKIRVDGDGSAVRDFLHVRDLVKVIETAVENAEDWMGKTITVGSGVTASVREIADLFVEYGGVEIERGPAAKVSDSFNIDLTPLHELYHNDMTTNIREDIKEIIDHASNRD